MVLLSIVSFILFSRGLIIKFDLGLVMLGRPCYYPLVESIKRRRRLNYPRTTFGLA